MGHRDSQVLRGDDVLESTVLVDPFKCRMWPFHDRLDEYLTEEGCRDEIQAFSKYGQLIPVLGRRLAHDPNAEVELIYGARRLFIARHLNIHLVVKIRDISDRDGLIAMDVENRHRKDVSPYERGLSYSRWIRGGQFNSQEGLAKTLHVSPSQVSRLLKLATLPSVVLSAFESPLDIAEGWGVELANAWQDPVRREILAQRAREITRVHPRLRPRQVYERLLSTSGRKPRFRALLSQDVVRAPNGKPLFRVSKQGNHVVLALPSSLASNAILDEIKHSISNILQHANAGGNSN